MRMPTAWTPRRMFVWLGSALGLLLLARLMIPYLDLNVQDWLSTYSRNKDWKVLAAILPALLAAIESWAFAFVAGVAVGCCASYGIGRLLARQKNAPTSAAAAVQSATDDGEDFIALEDAGRWIYENANEQIRDVLRGGVPSPFNSIAEHGIAFVREAAVRQVCLIYGRWEPGLPMEEINVADGTFTAFEAVFGTERRLASDLSIKRRDLSRILQWYEKDESAAQAEPLRVRRDTALREALMYVVTRRWGQDPMKDGGDHLKGLSAALDDFRQHAHDGAITVWGKANNHSVWQQIEPAYWLSHYVDLLALLRSDTRTKALNQLTSAPLFQELMVCRAEIEAEWPPARAGASNGV